MMDCRQIMELLDAYALGASDQDEARAIEGHVADCVRCWEEFSKSQQTAALLSLALPIQPVPERVGRRLMAAAARETPKDRRREPRAGLFGRLRLSWPALAGAMSLAGIASLAFAVFLQVQMNDLRDDKTALAEQVQSTNRELALQVGLAGRQLDTEKQMFAVLSAPDTAKVPLSPVSTAAPVERASVIYNWSAQTRKGFMLCQDMPPLSGDQVYQVWFTTNGDAHSAGTFRPDDGSCQVAMDLSFLRARPEGLGISVEQAGGSDRPTDKWLLYADFTGGQHTTQ